MQNRTLKPCTIHGCTKLADGFICGMHRARLRRIGCLELADKPPPPVIDASLVRDLFDYEPETGKLTNKISRKRARAGSIAGCLNDNGYLRVSVAGRAHYVQRIIWLHVHGTWPNGDVDHINGIRTDNRLMNLRDVPRSINGLNRHVSAATSGIVGAQSSGGKFQSMVKLNGERVYLGRFATAEEAGSARRAALTDPVNTLSAIASKREQSAPRRKLTTEQAKAVFAATGLQKDIAAKFGISLSMVSMIRSGKRHASR
jgi:hypothetical protein